MKAGYKAYTGHIFNQAEANALNQYDAEISGAQRPNDIEFLKDQKHRLFTAFSLGVTT